MKDDLLCHFCQLRLQTATTNGSHIAWLDNVKPYGEDKRPVLLLLHGFTADKTVWLDMCKHLQKDYRLVIPDLPFHGQSSGCNEQTLTASALASHFELFLKQLNLSKVTVIGNSLGGWIATHMAAQNNTCVDSIILINPAGLRIKNDTSTFGQLFKAGVNPFVIKNRGEFIRLFNCSMQRPPFLPKVIKDFLADQHIEKSHIYKHFFESCFVDDSLINKNLAKLATNSCLIFGMCDEIVSNQVVEHWMQIPNIKIKEFHDAGHMPMLEIPARTAHTIEQFLNSLKS